MVEQLEDDWPSAGEKKEKKPSKAARKTGDILFFQGGQ